MKSIKKRLALVVAVLMVVASAFTAFAATKDVEAVAGETAVVEFTYDPSYNLSGVLNWTADAGVVENVVVEFTDDLNKDAYEASLIGDNGIWVVPKAGVETVSGKITVCVKVTIAKDAAEGALIRVTLSGEYGDANKGLGDDTPIEETATITVKALDPETGDNGAVVLWSVVMVLAVACVVISRRRMYN